MVGVTSETDPSTWRRLLTRIGDGPDREALAELIGLWCGERGAVGGALYSEGEGPVAQCEARWGEGSFPKTLERSSRTEPASAAEGSPGPDHRLRRLDLPGGALLWRPAPDAGGAPDGAGSLDDPEPSGPLTLLLGAALANCRLRHRVKRQSFEANYRGVELEALYDVGLAIASTLDLDVLGEEILMRAVSLLDARRGALYLLSGDEHRLVSRFGGSAKEAFAAGRGESVPEDVLAGAEHLLSAPITVDGDRRGILVMADKESRFGVGPFTPEDRRTLSLFANQAAIALENARLHREALEKERYERDMQLAAEIQRQILPKGVPSLPGWELAGWNRPARQVGGDYYDLVPLGSAGGVAGGDGEDWDGGVPERLGIALGDVSGKGVPAALMVSTIHSAIRLLMGRVEPGASLVERLNRHVLASSAPNKFITLLMGELEITTGAFRYVNAGHNPGLLLRASPGRGAGNGRELERLAPGGLPVGLLPGSSYRADCARIEPGDLLCLYSDGITECVSRDDEEFGEERLIALLWANAHRPVAAIQEEVQRAVTEFADGAPQADDETLVLVRRSA